MGDGKIFLRNLHLNEEIEVQYRKADGSYDPSALQLVQKVLRCRVTQVAHDIPIKLLELVDQIQDHFGAHEVMVISGYRSPKFNERLLKTGHKVAKNSLHMQGYAMDIRLPGVRTEQIRDYARDLKIGGVGYYPHNGFVHVDIGRIRYW